MCPKNQMWTVKITPQAYFLSAMNSPERSAISPLIILAVELQPRLHFYLYCHPFDIQIDPETHHLSLRMRSWSEFRMIPWILSTVVVTGFFGIGCCSYVCITQYYSHLSTVTVPIFNLVIFVGGILIGLAQIISCLAPYVFPEIVQGFNQALLLERYCKS